MQANFCREMVSFVMKTVHGSDAAAAAGASTSRFTATPRRQLAEVHDVIVRQRPPQPPAASSNESTSAPRPSTPPPATPSRDTQVRLAAPPSIDLGDTSTWPPSNVPVFPDFVRSITEMDTSITTVRELADEYFVGTKGRPPLRLVEQMYGVDARKRGEHWRAKKFHDNSRKVYVEFQKRLQVWSWLEEQHDLQQGIEELQAAIKKEFPNEDPTRAHLKWLVETHMPSKKDGFAARSEQAKKNAKKRSANRAAKKVEEGASEEGATSMTKGAKRKK